MFYGDRVLLAAISLTPALTVLISRHFRLAHAVFSSFFYQLRRNRTWKTVIFRTLFAVVHCRWHILAAPPQVAVRRGKPACAVVTRRHVCPLRLLFSRWLPLWRLNRHSSHPCMTNVWRMVTLLHSCSIMYQEFGLLNVLFHAHSRRNIS